MNFAFTESEKKLISSLVLKGRTEQAKNERFAIIDLDSFYKLFEEEEVAVMQKWLAIKPQDMGYKLPFLGAKESPGNIVSIDHQAYFSNGKPHTIPCQYLPEEVYRAYRRLDESIYKDIGKRLPVLYGHRSVARQVFIFFDILERVYNFDFDKTIQRVCFPDYSEHVCTQRQAIDFTVQDASPSDNFDKTAEYAWLKKNANRFGFYESYSKNNKLGMMYEPWHWHYE